MKKPNLKNRGGKQLKYWSWFPITHLCQKVVASVSSCLILLQVVKDPLCLLATRKSNARCCMQQLRRFSTFSNLSREQCGKLKDGDVSFWDSGCNPTDPTIGYSPGPADGPSNVLWFAFTMRTYIEQNYSVLHYQLINRKGFVRNTYDMNTTFSCNCTLQSQPGSHHPVTRSVSDQL